MHAATARPEIARLLDLMEESHRAVRAARSTAGWMDLDLTLGQLRFLHSLNRAGSLSMGHVAEQLGVTLTTASQFVNRLERRGYVERIHRDDDRRVVECRLSERGAEITAAMRGMQRDVLAALLSNLKPRELKVLERLYRLMLERAGEAPSQAPQPLRPAVGVLAPSRGA